MCRYFERGSCRKDNCPFVHIKNNRKECHFYAQGYCRKGDKCNFYHPPKEEHKIAELKKELKYKQKHKEEVKQEESSEEEEVEETKVELEKEEEV